jgi:hypothetical protein
MPIGRAGVGYSVRGSSGPLGQAASGQVQIGAGPSLRMMALGDHHGVCDAVHRDEPRMIGVPRPWVWLVGNPPGDGGDSTASGAVKSPNCGRGPAGGEFTASGAVKSPNFGRGTGWWGLHRVRGGQVPKLRPRDRLVGIRPGQAIGLRRTGGSGPDHNRSVLRFHSLLSGEPGRRGSAEPTSGRRWPVRPFPCPGSTRIVDTMEMTRFSRRLK